MIVRNRLLAALGDDILREIAADLSEVVLPVGRVLYEAGHTVRDVCFPSSGVVSVITVMSDGADVESLTVGREGALGLVEALAGAHAEQRAVVQIAGSAWQISATRLRDLAREYPVVSDIALRYAVVSLAQLHQGAACNARHDIEPRLCRWLLTCEDRIGDEVIPVTHELLALMLGVQRTSVTVAAQALQRKGLIQYSRGRVRIMDRAGVEVAACECYRAAESVHGRLFRASTNGAGLPAIPPTAA
jgi:CRP-like cAMP-binding protein